MLPLIVGQISDQSVATADVVDAEVIEETPQT